MIVGQDWGGPQGVGAALQRIERLSALVLMNTFLTTYLGKFHSSAWPWTTWHAPLIGQYFQKIAKVLSHAGPAAVSVRGMSPEEARAYHHVFDESDSDQVVLTWPRTIPMREADRGWRDMQSIENRAGELFHIPILLLWAPEDEVFTMITPTRSRGFSPTPRDRLASSGRIIFSRTTGARFGAGNSHIPRLSRRCCHEVH